MQQNHSRLLKKRLALINELFERGEITEKTYDILDTTARVEAGILKYNEVFETLVNGYIPKI